jgi:threonyl-tRNA synthetase
LHKLIWYNKPIFKQGYIVSEVIGYIKDGQIVDTQSAKSGDKEILFDNSPQALEIIRHSAAHLMAQAIKELYPNTKFFVGPVIEGGFYYDFRCDEKITHEDLKKIEKKMKELAKKKLEITKYSLSKKEALEKFKDDDLKQYLINKIEGDEVTIYKQGDFEDLCRGPHLPNTGYLFNVKLTEVAGAYKGGDESQEMLTRIYGTAFADKESLKAHLNMLEEAKKRDHRKLGKELELFMFSDEAGAGLPFWLPKGARLRSKIEQNLWKAHRIRGYEPVRGPEILKSELWKKSGHYQNYGENIYFTEIDEQEYGLKPMNCVGHILIYKNSIKSYRDLPVKFFEYGVVHRHEKSGVLHGLLRVREFTQDDAHIFCTPNQIKDVIIEVMEFLDSVMSKFGFEYLLEIATKPSSKAIGDDEIWQKATNALKEALEAKGLSYGIDEGGGAFYGPKIDIKITDAIGRKWQCGTVQVDFNLPERLDMEYTDENNQKQRPVMIHRALLGSFERFIGILTEHYAGEFPTFIAPTQVIFVPISNEHINYAKELAKKFAQNEIDCEIYDKNDSLNKRIRQAEKQRVPYVVIVGDQEAANETVAIRDRRKKEQYNLKAEEFMLQLVNEIKEGEI